MRLLPAPKQRLSAGHPTTSRPRGRRPFACTPRCLYQINSLPLASEGLPTWTQEACFTAEPQCVDHQGVHVWAPAVRGVHGDDVKEVATLVERHRLAASL